MCFVVTYPKKIHHTQLYPTLYTILFEATKAFKKTPFASQFSI